MTNRLPGLTNLMAELEFRLTGTSVVERLPSDHGRHLADARCYVLVVIDGLGARQLGHPAAQALSRWNRATMVAPFPSTTSVALSTLATGLEADQHGIVSHLMWIPELGQVVNTLKWVTPAGIAVEYDTSGLLPAPNLWERLSAAGVEPITVQPGDFIGSPLSRLLYRGCRFEPVWGLDELVEATVAVAASGSRRLVLTYLQHVDYAGHVNGIDSPEYAEAMAIAAAIWERLGTGLPGDVALVGTADHGLIQYSESDKILVRERRFDDLRLAGDPRGLWAWGDGELIAELAADVGGAVVDARSLIGNRGSWIRPDGLILAPRDKVVLPRGFDKRLRAYHGGLEPEEVEIPLLVR